MQIRWLVVTVGTINLAMILKIKKMYKMTGSTVLHAVGLRMSFQLIHSWTSVVSSINSLCKLWVINIPAYIRSLDQ